MNNLTLSIRTFTGKKDSHSLFDLSSQKHEEMKFQFPVTNQTVYVYRQRQSSTFMVCDDTGAVEIDHVDFLYLTQFSVFQQNAHKIWIQFPKSIRPEENQGEDEEPLVSVDKEEVYIVVQSAKESGGSKLCSGQTIKLGKVDYFVSEIKEGGQVSRASRIIKKGIDREKYKILKLSSKMKEEGNKNACKICLQKSQSPANPLFNPCKCAGSCGTVHVNCLTRWISCKAQQASQNTMHFDFNKLECQICKQKFPLAVLIDGEPKQLLEIGRPEGDYIMLESANKKPGHILVIQQIPPLGIRIGRGQDCEVRVADISISRYHALMRNTESGLWLLDCCSRFGTLIRDQGLMRVELGCQMRRAVQIGGTRLYLEVRQSSDN